MPDAVDTPETQRSLDELRNDIRTWLAENFPPLLRDESVRESEAGLARQWRSAMGEKGWCMPEWPRAYGGGGLSPEGVAILAEELARIGAYNPVGTRERVFGTTLKEYGSEAQKLHHLPPMAKGTVAWCQGFSEPGAGSDLASLQMRAEETPDGFLLNGQKIWTSGALESQWCFCLVRTDRTHKHGGISFILVDMATPGFEVRPLRLIDGSERFCELFLTDVLVPKENILGKLNGGWEIARFQLQVERRYVAMSKSGHYGEVPGPPLEALAKQHIGTDDAGRLADPDLRARIARYLMSAEALRLTYRRTSEPGQSAATRAAVASILKNASAEVRQARAELSLEVLGYQGLGWSGEAFLPDELATARAFLSGKAMSIAAGSFEVQYNIIAKRVLGLPDTVWKS